MKKHEAIRQTEDYLLNDDRQTEDYCVNEDRQDKVSIANKYGKYRLQFLHFFGEFPDIRDDYLENITTAKHQIELVGNNACIVQSAPWRACPSAR